MKPALLWIAAAVTVFVACGEEDGCSEDDRPGLYQYVYTEVSGDCGPIPSGQIRIQSASALEPNCELLAPDTWSADMCRLNRHFVCDYGATTEEYVSYSIQEDPTGQHFYGEITRTVRDGEGIACTSTYQAEFERL